MAKSAPYMRLCGDHAPEGLESCAESTASPRARDLMPETDETQSDQTQSAPPPKKRRRRSAAPEAAETTNERPDGQVVDAPDDPSDHPDERMDAESAAVDLGAL